MGRPGCSPHRPPSWGSCVRAQRSGAAGEQGGQGGKALDTTGLAGIDVIESLTVHQAVSRSCLCAGPAGSCAESRSPRPRGASGQWADGVWLWWTLNLGTFQVLLSRSVARKSAQARLQVSFLLTARHCPLPPRPQGHATSWTLPVLAGSAAGVWWSLTHPHLTPSFRNEACQKALRPGP